MLPTPFPAPQLRTRLRLAVLVLLLGMLGTPLVLTLVFAPTSLDENRAASRYPGLPGSIADLALFPTRFELAFDRSFRLRPTLVRLWSTTVVLGLGGAALKSQAGAPTRIVVVGAGGELFYGGENSVEGHRAVVGPLADEVVRRWVERLSSTHSALTAQGIRHVVIFAPDKQTLHEEALPSWARRVGTPFMDRVIEGGRAQAVEIVDVRPALLSAMRSVRTTWRTDTHWNEVGACVAALEIKRVLTGVGTDACTDPLDIVDVPGGDLALLLGLQDDLGERLPVPRLAQRARAEGDIWRGTGQLRGILIGDSFAAALAPYLASTFATLRVVQEPPPSMVDVDVVVEEIVERRLSSPP